FMPIPRNDPADWPQYLVSQRGDIFGLKPKPSAGHLNLFTITVTPDGVIQQFAAVGPGGQNSSYPLQGQQSTDVAMSKFTFPPPKGVTLDAQRQCGVSDYLFSRFLAKRLPASGRQTAAGDTGTGHRTDSPAGRGRPAAAGYPRETAPLHDSVGPAGDRENQPGGSDRPLCGCG
ncbi:outer membrane lipoprotein chaperone LolA, partial [Morganella morganii]|nr:outer membrane lipoprotein chaperone LolA [Morganella morganii]